MRQADEGIWKDILDFIVATNKYNYYVVLNLALNISHSTKSVNFTNPVIELPQIQLH